MLRLNKIKCLRIGFDVWPYDSTKDCRYYIYVPVDSVHSAFKVLPFTETPHTKIVFVPRWLVEDCLGDTRIYNAGVIAKAIKNVLEEKVQLSTLM